MLKKFVVDGQMKGVAFCLRGLKISHQFFADDSLIFCQATREDYSSLEKTLEAYENALGQQLNQEKTTLFFSSNTPQDIQDDIKHKFRAEVIHQHETYLGLPSLVGKYMSNTFWQLKERLDNKLSKWKEKMLSQAGKEILIKAVAQTIPKYTMSVFKLPNIVCDKMTGMV